MITFDQFIDKYLGKKIDWDGFYGGQCMDLYHQYVNDCLGLEHPGASGAYKLWGYTWTDYDKISNTPTAVPQKGDIVVWNTKVGGGNGHVAVFIEGDVNGFTSLDQNWPTLDKVTKTKHDYNSIYGWLHPKGGLIPGNDEMIIKKTKYDELVNDSARLGEFRSAGYGSAAEVKQMEADKNKAIDEKNTINEAEKKRAEEFRKSYNELLSLAAEELGTQQEVNQVKVELSKISEKLDQLADLERNYAALQIDSGKREEELRAEIKVLQEKIKLIMKQKLPLSEYETQELLYEILRRLLRIVKLTK